MPKLDIIVDSSKEFDVISVHDKISDPLSFFSSQYSYSCDLINQKVEDASGVEKVLGYSNEEFENIPFFETLHSDDQEKATKIILACHNHLTEKKEIKMKETQMTLTYRVIHKDGHSIHVQHLITYSAVSSNGFGLKSYNMVTDISAIPFYRITGHLKCDCMEIGSNFDFLDESTNPNFCNEITKREREILQFLFEGKSSYEISIILEISKHTVDKHRRNMLNKANSNNTRELISHALSSGINFTI